MAWGDTGAIETMNMGNGVVWGPLRRFNPDSGVLERQYVVSTRVTQKGHSYTSANSERDVLMETPNDYEGIQVNAVGSSGQYWLTYTSVTTTWKTDPSVVV